MNPLRQEWHVDYPLKDFSLALFQAEASLRITPFTRLMSPSRSAKYREWESEDFNRIQAKPRAYGASSEHGVFKGAVHTITLEAGSIAKPIEVKDIKEAKDEGVNLARVATRFVTQQLLQYSLNKWVAAHFGAGAGWGRTVTGVSANPVANQFLQFNDANSVPLEVVGEEKIRILEATGQDADTLIVDPYTHLRLRMNPEIKETLGSDKDKMITWEDLARFFEVRRYIVVKGIRTTTNQDAATPVSAFMLPKGMLLMCCPDDADVDIATAGTTAFWSGQEGADPTTGIALTQYLTADGKTVVIDGEIEFGHAKAAAALGTFFASPVA